MTTDVDLSKDFIINRKYKLVRKIGSGSFGTIYLAIHLQKGDEIAVKLEPIKTRYPQLQHESNVYRVLGVANGIPVARFFGIERGYNCLVMERLGPSLEDVFNRCSRRFSMKTTLMLAELMIKRIEFMHAKTFIYRDVKPDNFLMGVGQNASKLYLVDYGLVKHYRDPRTRMHIPYSDRKSLTGTARYASINSHQGIEMSRRDDLESIGYVLIYFLKGRLPWQGLQTDDKEKKYQAICDKKMSTPLNILCEHLPDEFEKFVKYCRRLGFDQQPDYNYCYNLFNRLFDRLGYTYDLQFDWTVPPQLTSSARSTATTTKTLQQKTREVLIR